MGDLIDELEPDVPAEQYVLSGGEAKFICDLVRRLNISPSVLTIGFDNTHDKMMADYAFMDIPELMACVPWEISAFVRDIIIDNKYAVMVIMLADHLGSLRDVMKQNLLAWVHAMSPIPDDMPRIVRCADIEKMIPRGMVRPDETVPEALERAYHTIGAIRYSHIFNEMKQMISHVAGHKRFTHLRVCTQRDIDFAKLNARRFEMADLEGEPQAQYYLRLLLLRDTSSLVRCILHNLRSANQSLATYSIVNEDEIEEDHELEKDDGIRGMQANGQPERVRFDFDHLKDLDMVPNHGVADLEHSDDILTRLFYLISCGTDFDSLHGCSLYIISILIRELNRMSAYLCHVQPAEEQVVSGHVVNGQENVQVELLNGRPLLPPDELGHEDLALKFVDQVYTPYQLKCLLNLECFQDLTHLELSTTLRIDQLAAQLVKLNKLDTFVWENDDGRNEPVCLSTEHTQSQLIQWCMIPALNSVRTLMLHNCGTNKHTRMERLSKVFPKLVKLVLRPYQSGTIIGTSLYNDLLLCRQLVHLHVYRKDVGQLIIPQLGYAFYYEEVFDPNEIGRVRPKATSKMLWIGYPLEEKLIMDRNHIMVEGAHNHRNLISFAQNDRDVIELFLGVRPWNDNLLTHFHFI